MTLNYNDMRASTAPPLPGVAPPRRRSALLTIPFVAVMAVVAAIAGIYYAVIAAPMYVSTASFTIQRQAPTNAPLNIQMSVAAAAAGAGALDIVPVQEFIRSHEMLEALDAQYKLRESYSRFRPDVLRWLRPGASDAAFLRFYRRMVTVRLDREAFIVQVSVRSFDRETAPRMAETILQRTEAFVDGMSRRVRQDAVANAQAELARAEADAARARQAVASFRGSAAAVDPAIAGAQTQSAEAALNAQSTAVQAQIAALLTYSRPDAPVVRQLQAQLASIRAEAARLRAVQAGAASGLPGQVTGFETLQVERTAAEQKAQAARLAYQAASAAAVQNEKFVVRVVNPNRPDTPTEPKRLLDFLMVLLFAMTGYAIVSLLIAGIRDHRGV